MCGARSARGFVFPLHIVLFSVDLRWRHKQVGTWSLFAPL
jgi:hypothetical protein